MIEKQNYETPHTTSFENLSIIQAKTLVTVVSIVASPITAAPMTATPLTIVPTTPTTPVELAYLERLIIDKDVPQLDFNFLGELQNLYVQIPLLQARKEIPIYAKTVKDMFLKKPGRKSKDLETVKGGGKLSALILGKTSPSKNDDLENLKIIVQMGEIVIPNTLVDLGVAINIMTKEIVEKLGIIGLRPTSTVLQLANRSTIWSEGIVEDVNISLDSWEYLVDFLVL